MGRTMFVIRYRWWIIAVTILVCLLSIIPLLRININSDLETYLPDSMSSRKNNKLIEQSFGKDDPLVLVFSSDDVLNESTLKRVQSVSRDFNRMGQFDLVMSLFDASSIEGTDGTMVVEPVIRRIPRSDESREKLREDIKNNEIVYKQLVSEDFKHCLIVLNGSRLKDDKVMLDSVRTVLSRYPGNEIVNMFGQPYLRDEANSKIFHDLVLLLPLGLLIMFLFLWASFRDLRMVWLPFSVVVIAIILSLMLIPLFNWQLSIIGVLIPIMMIAIANNYGIHVVTRNQELNRDYPTSTRNRMVTNLVLFLQKPVLFTGFTTIVGIAGLVMHILKPARQMGIVSALGIGFALFLSLTFIPAILSMQSRNAKGDKGKYSQDPQKWQGTALRAVAGSIVRRPKTVVIVFASVFLISLFFLPGMKVAPDFNNILPAKHPFNKALQIINKDFGGSRTISILFEGDIKDPALLGKIDFLEEDLKKRPEIGNVASISTVIRLISKALNNPDDPEYDRIPATREAVSQYLELYAMNGDPEDIEQFVDFDYTKAVMNIQYRAGDIKTVNRLVKHIDDLTKEKGMDVTIGGYSLVEKELSMAVTLGQKNSLIFAFLLITLLLIIIFRSLPAGLLGSLPLLFAVICTFGLMCITGTELNIVTALLSSISIGLGVDYTIHIFWRIKSELQTSPGITEAVVASIVTTGRGIAINALSVMAGFAVLLFSGFPLIRSFAFLIIASIGFCLLCSLILIPAICLLVKPRFLYGNKLNTNKNFKR
ncbi:MAG: RND family transporter [Bacteroidales bacterium]|nr:RND family transporter [Bacteroidales bacterium]